MRKEVKLGMVIGGGLIALLVAYLLVAPPNNNKKGAAFADNGGGANPAAPGDVAQPGDLGAEDPAAANRTLVGATDPAPAPATSAKTEVKADATAKGAPAPAPGNADWGKTLGGVAQGSPAKPAPKTDAGNVADGGAAATVGRTGTALTTEAPARAMYSDPNAAWGDGVSTDAPALGSIRRSTKSHLIAGPAPAAIGTTGGAPGTTHTVQAGDTLSSISASAYGTPHLHAHILKANPGVNPNNLKLGTVLKLPAVDEVKAASAAERKVTAFASPAAPDVRIDTTRQYKVQQNDSLYKIASKLYGKGTMADKLYERNKAAIGPDPKRLKLGMILDLPEAPLAGPASANTPALASPAQPESMLQNDVK
ncbi:MAG TPA: LysM peptidoglycan-binding domain-containing protein [Tepidisphaeraceae bacterium]|nr:LysM peptidoglycan-binding domain-containing protein [Tepidisphaeraceae bacterium]